MINLKTSDLDLIKTTANTRDITAYFHDNTKNKRKGADDHQHLELYVVSNNTSLVLQ